MMLIEHFNVIPAKPESRFPAGMLLSCVYIPAFAGMTEMGETMIKI